MRIPLYLVVALLMTSCGPDQASEDTGPPDASPVCEEDPADFCCCNGDVVNDAICGEDGMLTCLRRNESVYTIEACHLPFCDGPCSLPCNDTGTPDAGVRDAGAADVAVPDAGADAG